MCHIRIWFSLPDKMNYPIPMGSVFFISISRLTLRGLILGSQDWRELFLQVLGLLLTDSLPGSVTIFNFPLAQLAIKSAIIYYLNMSLKTLVQQRLLAVQFLLQR